ncbi:glycoside hydrolase family 2 protein [Thermophagus sp. OGC60D27]|uniref:glycoside hydrolase family 2 protein n=1 Tax=Thermophagus sp. OGC60D27 TaxID=3458415 RepID=UPI0040381481
MKIRIINMRVIVPLIVFLFSGMLKAQKWEMAEVPLSTKWGHELTPENVYKEYPRPIMKRAGWLNLNGIWQFQPIEEGDEIAVGDHLDGEILVPFPWESALSGVRKQFDSQRACYKRFFEIPKEWRGQNVILHFGAVDWEAKVILNGSVVGIHRGGYDAFSFDVTGFLRNKGKQELIVEVFDPSNSEPIAAGKQNEKRFNDPQRFVYAPSSGIWQTVWLEPVAKTHIKNFHAVPDIDKESLELQVEVENFMDGYSIEVNALEGDQNVARYAGTSLNEIALKIENPRLWSPDDPFLYDLSLVVKDSVGQVVDSVMSYFGMRKISLKKEFGMQRIFLNNEYLFQMGPLDQGYWPDGLYTAPSDEAMQWEIRNMKEWGFNMVRKHIKVEPQRWYYHCDKEGILVWQDMPGTFQERDEMDKIQFEAELQKMVKSHWNHPSIINWVVFNEHWGVYDVERNTKNVMALDPSRLVTGNTGIDAGKPSVDFEVGHIKSNHSYRPPNVALVSAQRATVCGEYGAIGYNIDGHIWDEDGPWVHYNYEGKEAATAEYERFVDMILGFQAKGLNAAVYTQWTDVENEMNGLFTYDRKVEKLDKTRVTKANKSTWESQVKIELKNK